MFWSSGSVKNSSGMYFSSYLIWPNMIFNRRRSSPVVAGRRRSPPVVAGRRRSSPVAAGRRRSPPVAAGRQKGTTTTTTTIIILFPGRSVLFSLRDKFGEGFFPPSGGGGKLANLPTPALPYPSFPALFRQDTTYAWRTAYA